jgi:opacity protein-like surface antigen
MSFVGAVLLVIAGGVQTAHAQAPSAPAVSPSLFVGIAVPTGDLHTTSRNAGYTAGGALDLRASSIPVGLRAEAAYMRFGIKNGGGNLSDLSGRLNAVIPVHLVAATPYLIGGVGEYHVKADLDGVASNTQNRFGYNVGAGIDLPLGSLGGRIEARYHHISLDGGGDYSYVPITFSVRF